MGLITDIALHGDGADRFRALKLLQTQKQQDAILPEPLTHDEIVERMTRLMRGTGRLLARRAYMKAFPNRVSVANAFAITDSKDLVGIDPRKLPKSLKQLYRKYPEIKQAGFPKGYPLNKGPEVRMAWCKKTAIQIELDRKDAQRRGALIELETPDHDGPPPELGKDAENQTTDIT